jgi:hypothetical protein
MPLFSRSELHGLVLVLAILSNRPAMGQRPDVDRRDGIIVLHREEATLYFPEYVKIGDTITWGCESQRPVVVTLGGTPFVPSERAQTFTYRITAPEVAVSVRWLSAPRPNGAKTTPLVFSLERPAYAQPDRVQMSSLTKGAALTVTGDFEAGDAANARATMNGVATKPLIVAASSHVALLQFPGQFGQVTVEIGRSFFSSRIIHGHYLTDKETVTVMIEGLTLLSEPIEIGFWNRSYVEYVLEGGVNQVVAIEPHVVPNEGRFVTRRRFAAVHGGILSGPFQLGIYLGRSAPAAALAAEKSYAVRQSERAKDTATATLAAWQANTGVRIESAAEARIVADFRSAIPLMKSVQATGTSAADNPAIQRQLLRHYCFELRDMSQGRLGRVEVGRPRMRLAFQPPTGASATISTGTVERFSFATFLRNFLSGKDNVVVGYIELKSMPERAAVYIDGTVPKGFTNRTFVSSVGPHNVRVAIPGGKDCSGSVVVAEGASSLFECK